LADGWWSGASSARLAKTGLNMSLPDAHNGKDSVKDKMSFYAKGKCGFSKREVSSCATIPILRLKPNDRFWRKRKSGNFMQSRVRAIRERIKIPF
jgi:hypothetical protein